MKMQEISIDQLQQKAIASLGLDPEAVDYKEQEALAALIRQVASYCCPCSMRRIVDTATNVLTGVYDSDQLREDVKQATEEIIAFGDLIEGGVESEDGIRDRQIFLFPPSFIARASGTATLLGVRPGGFSLLHDDESRDQIEYAKYARRITGVSRDVLSERLLNEGLQEIEQEAWLEAPEAKTAEQVVDVMMKVLDRSPPCGMLESLEILDPTKDPTYYRGRWVKPKRQTGHFVARRPQKYGADLWCCVKLQDGSPTAMIDLPHWIDSTYSRGCDEAWHLQAAIDSINGSSQMLRLREGYPGRSRVDVFSPLPQWLVRRWSLFGEPTEKYKCLMSFVFRNEELEEEIQFARQHFWLQLMK